MSENINLHWAVSRVLGDTLDLLEDEERRCLDLSVLQCSILRQMTFPWARLFTRLVEDHGDYQTTVEMPQAYIDALEELELLLGGGYDGPKEGCLVGEIYHDRGNPSAWDYTIGDFTANGTWRSLDVSAIVDNPDATRVLLRGRFKDNLVGQAFFLREYGDSGQYDAIGGLTQVTGVLTEFHGQVELGVVQQLEYLIASGMDEADLLIRGWWVPAV
jgi:hypothetical protein